MKNKISDFLEMMGIPKSEQAYRSKVFLVALACGLSTELMIIDYHWHHYLDEHFDFLSDSEVQEIINEKEKKYRLENNIPEGHELKRILEPGEHVIRTNVTEYVYDKFEDICPEIPEGYEMVDHYFEKSKNPFVRYEHVFIFVNSKEVEAVGHFEFVSNELLFTEFGTPVEQKTMALK